MSISRILTLLISVLLSSVSAKIDSIVVLPHGEYLYSPGSATGAAALKRGAETLVSNLKSSHGVAVGSGTKWDFDLIFISTPHGTSLDDKYLLYLGSELSGSTTLGTGANAVTASLTAAGVSGDPLGSAAAQIEAAVNAAVAEATNTKSVDAIEGSGQTGATTTSTPELKWGEVIPLSFFSNVTSAHSYRLEVPTIVFSFAAQSALDSESKLKAIGKKLYGLFQGGTGGSGTFPFASKKILWIVSADLAHTHQKYGPYGFSESSAPFETAAKEWVASTGSTAAERYGEMKREEENGAGSCGLSGFMMVEGAREKWEADGERWTGTVHSHAAPTYYGMMTATWIKSSSGTSSSSSSLMQGWRSRIADTVATSDSVSAAHRYEYHWDLNAGPREVVTLKSESQIRKSKNLRAGGPKKALRTGRNSKNLHTLANSAPGAVPLVVDIPEPRFPGTPPTRRTDARHFFGNIGQN